MNKSTMEAFMAWGDRANRDTAHLLDLAVAGTIDAICGHGTVVLRPVRLEEIASRIGRREHHPDGAWIVSLRARDGSTPEEDEALPRFEFGVPVESKNTEETSAEIASLAGTVMNLTPEQIGKTGVTVEMLLGYAKRLAGSALTQRPDRD